MNLLVDLQEKWDFALLDLWHDTVFNALSPEERALYMNDAIHPTRAGYLPWWLPRFQKILTEVLAKE